MYAFVDACIHRNKSFAVNGTFARTLNCELFSSCSMVPKLSRWENLLADLEVRETTTDSAQRWIFVDLRRR